MLAEEERLRKARDRSENWQRWGPYLAERQWGTVREDYSGEGDPWLGFSHDAARSRAYRWGEDGLLGFTDRECRLCFALALWNGRDPILKERFFGLTNHEGNNGEDVKERYFYLDATPTSSYVKSLYKYPRTEYPYELLAIENKKIDRGRPEFEIEDTGVFDGDNYFDVTTEYAKADPDDIYIRITVTNRAPAPALIHVIPQLWFRNTWDWGCDHEGCWIKPSLKRINDFRVEAKHVSLGPFCLDALPCPDGKLPQWLFTENETNTERLFSTTNKSPYTRDAFHERIIGKREDAVNPACVGTKCGAWCILAIQACGDAVLLLRLHNHRNETEPFTESMSSIVFAKRIIEADAFFAARIPDHAAAEEREVFRQAYAGLLQSKQFYHFSVREWLKGDPGQPTPPPDHAYKRNIQWTHLFNRDLISVPDKWEYPWYASWDLVFHMIPMATLDPDFAKHQLLLLLREWYMHPNGQIPAYEFEFSDVNPPVHAWACWRLYKMTGQRGGRDRCFLERAFVKLLINFTWWVNRKDPEGRNLFAGGFLGLDNIGLFDRSKALPDGARLEQADATAWMAFYCGSMLSMALELAREDKAYEDLASKFFEHFIAISDAMNTLGGAGLWDEDDGFYYDQILCGSSAKRLKVRSMVGLIPLLAVEVLESEVVESCPGFMKRMRWFLDHRPDLKRYICCMEPGGRDADNTHSHHLLAVVPKERLIRILNYLLNENEFLSPHGVRSLSRFHLDHPYSEQLGFDAPPIRYIPGDSTIDLFGGNSNWRGPIWFPLNYLLMEALERYHHFYGDSLKVNYPSGTKNEMNLQQVADSIAGRLSTLFLRDSTGARPVFGKERRYADDPNWKELILFHEFFDGDNGRGLGACHQTGWTALITRVMEQRICARARIS
jgi:glycogen debranching enzyme